MSILFSLIINQSSVGLRSFWQFNFFIKSIPIIPSHGYVYMELYICLFGVLLVQVL